MSGFRLSAVAILGAIGVLLGAAGAPVVASADSSGDIAIVSAGPDASGDPYDLTVLATDSNGVTISPMTAHVYSASEQDVADVPMQCGPPAGDGTETCTAISPISPAALPAGTYSVTVDAADGVESDTAIPAPGSFSVSYSTSSLVVTPTPPSVVLGSQSVTFSGTLTGADPGASAVPIANAPVSLSVSGAAASVVATTDADGDFSYTVPGISQSADYNFSVLGATDLYPGASDDVTVPVQQATTSIVASADPPTVTEGIQSVTFSGSVSATVPAPAPGTSGTVNIGSGVPVYLSVGGGAPQQVATTDGNGNFSYASENTAPGTYTFSVAATSLYTGDSYPVTVGSQMAPTSMTVQASQPDVTFGSQSVTFTGTVTADPQGASDLGVASAPVYLTIGTGPAQQVTTTDGNGNFSYTVGSITAGSDYDFAIAQTPLYDGASDDVSVPLVPGQTTLAVTASPPDGGLSATRVTFSGSASVTPSGDSAGTPIGQGVPVYLSISGATATRVATTDASGKFSYTATGPKEPADYDFEIQAGTLYTPASDVVPLGPGQQSALSVTPSGTSVTKGAQSVTFDGHLTGTEPGTTTPNNIQNAAVWLRVGSGPVKQIATTDANGDFSYRVSGLSKATTYTFSVTQTSSYTAATSTVDIGVTQAATRITGISVSPAHLRYGQKGTLTGTVQYQSGSAWKPVSGATVRLAETKTSLGSVVTSSKGVFRGTLPTTHGPGWSATVAAGPLTQQAMTTGNLSIAVPLKVRSFSARLTVTDSVSITGCLQVTAPVGYGPQTSVTISYRAGTHGAWKRLGRLDLHNRAGRYRTCPSADESYFSGSLPARLANAYYRARFTATSSFQSATSKSVHAWKYRTRIVSFSVSSRSVSRNGYITLKARLEVDHGTWRPWAGQAVSFLYNYLGTSSWAPLTKVHTNASGYATLRVLGTTGSFVAVMYAAYGGNKTHLASQSKGIDVSVNNGTAHGRPAVPGAGQLPDLGQLPGPQIPMLPVLGLTAPPMAALMGKN